MSSPTSTMSPTNNLPAQLKHIGLKTLPANLDDFLARATKARWSPRMLLEQLAQEETQDRSRRSLERRLRLSAIKKFKPMADFEWDWPTKVEREVIERALTLDFIHEARNFVLVGQNGLGKNHDRPKYLPPRRVSGLLSSVSHRCRHRGRPAP